MRKPCSVLVECRPSIVCTKHTRSLLTQGSRQRAKWTHSSSTAVSAAVCPMLAVPAPPTRMLSSGREQLMVHMLQQHSSNSKWRSAKHLTAMPPSVDVTSVLTVVVAAQESHLYSHLCRCAGSLSGQVSLAGQQHSAMFGGDLIAMALRTAVEGWFAGRPAAVRGQHACVFQQCSLGAAAGGTQHLFWHLVPLDWKMLRQGRSEWEKQESSFILSPPGSLRTTFIKELSFWERVQCNCNYPPKNDSPKSLRYRAVWANAILTQLLWHSWGMRWQCKERKETIFAELFWGPA